MRNIPANTRRADRTHRRGNTGRRIWRYLLLLVCGVLPSSCLNPTAPEDAFPHTAVLMNPVPDVYPQWWAEVEECAGIKRNYRRFRFFEVPGTGHWIGESGYHEGAWIWNRITVGETGKLLPLLVRHEMLHAILQRGDHPDEYFETKCGSIAWP